LLEEMGRACLPGPYFSTVVLAGGAIMEAGSEEQKQKLLGEISEGKLIATLALTEPSASYKANDIQVTAAAEGGGHVINGTKLFVPDANVADVMVVVARTGGQGAEGLTLFLVDPKASGVSITQLKTIASDKLCEVTFDKVKVGQDAVLGEVGKGWPMVETVLQKAAVAKCAEMVGGAQQVLEMTVNYSKERVQFGRPIGSFQAIQHHCANMAIDVDGSRFISYQAAWMLSEGMPSTKEVAMAKSWTSDAYRRLTALGHQVHGGIGFTKDHDMQLYYRRAKAAEVTFGDGDFHRDVVASEIGLPDPA
ncbi:MAG: acyl-CoA dehydrogenase, partial [Dehalococcoidia bacterium]|nr:acyl-CoA dehydrogenase [Dehalococcoidia bacterium]